MEASQKQGVKREALALIVLVIVAIGAVAAVFVTYTLDGQQVKTTAFTETTPPPTSCTATFPGGLQLESGSNDTVFVMRPSTTALLCVTYDINATQIQGEDTTLQFGGSVEVVNATYSTTSGGEYGYSYHYSPAPGITDTADPASATFQSGNNITSITIVYTITASAQSTGFYALGYPLDCPPLIPLAVTNGDQKITADDFPGFFGNSCVTEPPYGKVEVTGIAGFNTSLVST